MAPRTPERGSPKKALSTISAGMNAVKSFHSPEKPFATEADAALEYKISLQYFLKVQTKMMHSGAITSAYSRLENIRGEMWLDINVRAEGALRDELEEVGKRLEMQTKQRKIIEGIVDIEGPIDVTDDTEGPVDVTVDTGYITPVECLGCISSQVLKNIRTDLSSCEEAASVVQGVIRGAEDRKTVADESAACVVQGVIRGAEDRKMVTEEMQVGIEAEALKVSSEIEEEQSKKMVEEASAAVPEVLVDDEDDENKESERVSQVPKETSEDAMVRLRNQKDELQVKLTVANSAILENQNMLIEAKKFKREASKELKEKDTEIETLKALLAVAQEADATTDGDDSSKPSDVEEIARVTEANKGLLQDVMDAQKEILKLRADLSDLQQAGSEIFAAGM